MIKRVQQSGRMSQAVVYNGVVYLAGQIAAGATAKDQTENALAQVEALLAEVGSSKDRLLTVTIWLADMADFAEMNEVWDQWVAGIGAPARATGEARLATPDYKVEIIVTAAVGEA